jgi:hypothetical protein
MGKVIDSIHRVIDSKAERGVLRWRFEGAMNCLKYLLKQQVLRTTSEKGVLKLAKSNLP